MIKIREILSNVIRHELISGSFFVFLGTTASSFLAFILNIYFARNLSYSDYGEYSSLISLITLLTIPAGSLSAVVVRYATEFLSKNELGKASTFYKKTFFYILIFSFIANLSFIVVSPFILSFLKIKEVGLLVLVGFSIATFYLATLNLAFIQSLLKFRLLGFLYVIAGIGKLIAGIGLIILGFRVYGAIVAVIIFSVIDFILSLLPLKEIINSSKKSLGIHKKELISYAFPTMISIFALSSFISTDVLLVKHFFNLEEAGFYGGLSLIGRVIFYFTGPIPMAMFPLIVKRHTSSESYSNLFYISIILVLLPSILITIFYYMMPNLVINVFLGGGDYDFIAPYLGLFGIFLTFFSINNVFVNFFLSIKKIFVCVPVSIFAVLQVISINYFHQDFRQIILISIICSLLLMISLVMYYLKINKLKLFN